MDISFYGANCFRVTTKETSVVIDDNLSSLGQKSIIKKDEVLLLTQKVLEDQNAANTARLVLKSPGEYEIGDLTIRAVQARAHIDQPEGPKTAVVYQMLYDGLTVTFLGHISPDSADDIIEIAGGTDVLVVPVGGNGFTLDAVGASGLIKKIEPDVVIPAYYHDSSLNFEVPAAPLSDFLKSSGLQPSEQEQDSYKIKRISDLESGQTRLVVLNKLSR